MMLSDVDRQILDVETGAIVQYLEYNDGPGMGNFSEVSTHVYVTNWNNAQDIHNLKDYNIRGVINLTGQELTTEAKRKYRKHEIAEMPILIGDSVRDSIGRYFNDTYHFIHGFVSKGERVLVHSESGTSRPGAIVAYYLLRRFYVTSFQQRKRIFDLVDTRKFFLLSILKFMKMGRGCIHPNPGFVYQLVLAELLLKRDFAVEYESFKKQEKRERKEKRRARRALKAKEQEQQEQKDQEPPKEQPKQSEPVQNEDAWEDSDDVWKFVDEPKPKPNPKQTPNPKPKPKPKQTPNPKSEPETPTEIEETPKKKIETFSDVSDEDELEPPVEDNFGLGSESYSDGDDPDLYS